jgi:hypothetical protein
MHFVLSLLFTFKSSFFFSETAEQISTKLARNVHWMVLFQICVFGDDLKSNMDTRVHNVFSIISAKFGSNLLCGFRKKDVNVKFP